jgi:SAM-dependent methyltransferase
MIQPIVTLAHRAAHLNAHALTQARHDHDCVYRSLRARLTEVFGPSLRQARLLDFGCGFTYPLLVLLARDVGEITGLEVAPVYRDGAAAAARWGGGLRKPGSTAEALLAYARAARYYRHLSREAGVPVRHRDYRIVRYAGEEPPLPEGAFDCVISNAVLQELPGDLSVYARRIAGLLRPGGCIDLEWHNFYSWSGHYMGEAESRRHPWGHLLEGRCHPDLNRATPEHVRDAFAPYFTDLRLLRHDRRCRIAGRDPDYEPEGLADLTPERRSRLAAWPEEWLTTRGYILQGRRPDSPPRRG